jgi:regulator of ribonuclease activity A
MNIKTADLCDEHIEKLQVAEDIFNDFGGRRTFHGEIITVKVFEDNSLVRTALEANGTGKVLVVDGGGSQRCALIGGLIAVLAEKNNWNGMVVNGCIRDSEEISKSEIGLKAIGTCPVKSIKRGEGQTNIPVRFAGVNFIPGHFLYADEDGLVVSEKALH